jgi:hypothetical protein
VPCKIYGRLAIRSDKKKTIKINSQLSHRDENAFHRRLKYALMHFDGTQNEKLKFLKNKEKP